MIKVQNLVLGMLSTNCYLVQNPDTREILIIDPAASPERIRKKTEELGGTPIAILLTHGHFDHMSGAQALKDFWDIPIYAHGAEKKLLADARMNLSGTWSSPVSLIADQEIFDGEILELAGFRILVIHTPGHTAGGVSYYFEGEEVLFSGDTLFCESYGRYDFPTSSGRDLVASIRRLLTLPEDTIVYPGHNEATTISHEKRYNPIAGY